MDLTENFTLEDQLIMAEAGNYCNWLFSLIAPCLTGQVLEVGAGIGNISQLVLDKAKKIQGLTCVELNDQCYDYLQKRFDYQKLADKLKIVRADFLVLDEQHQYDCIFNINVLEHLKDDQAALQKMNRLLKDSGFLLCFVPAFQLIYGSLDKKLQHYRRYSATELRQKLEASGFNIISLRYYNIVGFFGWWINNRLLKLTSQNKRQVLLFDKYIFPVQKKVEEFFRFPLGQSLFCIAKKEGSGERY